MRLRTLSLLLVVTALAGCAQVLPEGRPTPGSIPATASATPSADPNADPTPSAEPLPQLTVAAGTTPAEQLLGAVAAQALLTAGVEGVLIPAPESNELLEQLADGTIAFYPGFTATLLEQNLGGDEPPAPDEVPGVLAAKVGPEISLLQPTALDGQLVWASCAEAEEGQLVFKTWGDIFGANVDWQTGPTGMVPGFAMTRSDGVPGVEAVYTPEGSKWNWVQQDDPAARRAALLSLEATVAAFRAIDYPFLDGLNVLEDTRGFGMADPVAVLFTSTLADSNPQAVLAVDKVFQAFTAEGFAQLEAQVVSGQPAAQVAAAFVASVG
ncbi:MAG: hypothetical protein LBQ92_02010 [Propionibacteriaceae bacterium]|jgi:glycine betaine/choline ABC-type transport system substrate-binding protein|nr:hypothetical protein [Propionibacteriaceae bacterium]